MLVGPKVFKQTTECMILLDVNKWNRLEHDINHWITSDWWIFLTNMIQPADNEYGHDDAYYIWKV